MPARAPLLLALALASTAPAAPLLSSRPSAVGTWSAYPNALPDSKLPDLPLVGNGVIGVILDASSRARNASATGPGHTNSLDFYVNANAFWSCTACSPGIDPDGVDQSCCAVAALGGVSLRLPALAAPLPGFSASQAIGNATLGAAFAGVLSATCAVHPTEAVLVLNASAAAAPAGAPLLLLQLATWVHPASAQAGWPAPARAGCATQQGAEAPDCAAPAAALAFASRNASTRSASVMPVAGALATGLWLGPGAQLLGVAPAPSGDEVLHTVLLPPGAWVAAATAVRTTRGPGLQDPVAGALAAAAGALAGSPGALAAAADAWWGAFWSASGVALPTRPALQALFDGAQYVLAGASAATSARDIPAPGLYGPWASRDNPAWQGDYTLDYNYNAPYYGAFASGHGELAEAYWQPLLDWMAPSGAAKARAQAALAHATGCAASALYYNCHLAPYGQASTDPMSRFMTWNLPHALLPLINHWEYTHNVSFARSTIYPLLAGAMDWYACYLRQNSSSGVWNDDSPFNPDYEHEGQPTVNPTIALALIQRVASAAVAVAAALGVTPPAAVASIAAQLAPVSTLEVPAPGPPRNWTVFENNRCTDVASSWTFYGVPDLAACQRRCDGTAGCDLVSYCPPVAVNNASGCSGAGGQPAPLTCWGMPRSQLPHCHTDAGVNRGWTSAAANASSAPNATQVRAWATHAGQTQVGQGDWFAAYAAWPAEACDPASPWTPALGALARATVSLYGSDFATGRGVDIAAQAVRAGARSSSGGGGGALDGYSPSEVADGLDAFLARSFGASQLAYAPGGGIENTGMSRAVCEMLLQSYLVDAGGARAGAGPLGAYVLALFPFWPSGEAAAFWGLRAKGGFAVNASTDGARVAAPVAVTAQSAFSSACLVSPWGASPVAAACGGQPAPVTRYAFGILCWEAPQAATCLLAPTSA